MTYSLSFSKKRSLTAFLGVFAAFAAVACGQGDAETAPPAGASTPSGEAGAAAEQKSEAEQRGGSASGGKTVVPSLRPLVVPASAADEGFGQQGAVTFEGKEGLGLEVHGLAIGPQGSVYVAGRHGGVVVALDGTGKVDRGFGRSGIAVYGTEDFYTTSLALQPDGKLVIGGLHTITEGYGDELDPNLGPPNQASFFRVGPDGQLDPAFGQGGISVVRLPEQVAVGVQAMAAQPDGKLLAAGGGGVNSPASDSGDFALLRLDDAGALDETFAAPGGFALYDVSPDQAEPTFELALSVLPGPNGTAYVFGYGTNPAAAGDFSNFNEDCLLARYLPDGRLDPSFGRGGVVYAGSPVPAGAAPARNFCRKGAVDAEGRVVIGGNSESDVAYDFMLARYLPDGQPDPSFGQGGTAIIDVGGQNGLDQLYDFALLPDGAIVAVGMTNAESLNVSLHGVVLRVGADGAVDPSFGEGGVVRIAQPGDPWIEGGTADPDQSPAYATLDKVAVQPDGKIVVGGRISFDAAFVVRLD